MLWTFRGDDVVVCSSGEAHQSPRPTGRQRERGASSTNRLAYDDASLQSTLSAFLRIHVFTTLSHVLIHAAKTTTKDKW